MSELEPSAAASSHDNPRASRTDDLGHLLGDPALPEREGLPQTYRMRADSHYVDQLEAHAGTPAIRVVATRHIECGDLPPLDRLEPLIRSIAAQGVVQPLLVRRQGGRYKLIAGRKRLAAALAAGLANVPCLLHEVDESAAATLAEAENLRVSQGDASAGAERDRFGRILQSLTSDLTTIATSAAMLKPGPSAVFRQQVAADFIEAQAWHAAWLVASAREELDTSRLASVAGIFARVAGGFEAQSRLTGLQLECSIAPSAAQWALDEELTVVALTGCVFATITFLEGVDRPRIELRAEAPQARTLKLEVVQRSARLAPDLARHLHDPALCRPGDLIPALALRSASAIAIEQAGTVELSVHAARGSAIQIAFQKPQAN